MVRQKFHDRFGRDRILHQDEINAGTRNIEMPITGMEPWQLAPDLLIITVPGHTKGHTVLLYQNKFLFSGDRLAWSARLNQLIAFRSANCYSWPATTESMRKLANYNFEWVLPGHDRARAMVSAALNGDLERVNYKPHPIFRIAMPESVPGVPSEMLDPRNAWDDPEAYDEQARELARQFAENFKQFNAARQEILEAGPHIEAVPVER